jgi:hypothetical protein
MRVSLPVARDSQRTIAANVFTRALRGRQSAPRSAHSPLPTATLLPLFPDSFLIADDPEVIGDWLISKCRWRSILWMAR